MDEARKPGFSVDFAAALDWWRDAGVDCDFVDEPIHWLAAEVRTETAEMDRSATGPSRRTAAPSEGANAAPPRIDPASLPHELPAFVQWWRTEPSLAEGPAAMRVPPRGKEAADLMVIVPEPESGDRDILLSGPQGRLLQAIFAAMGLGEDQTYLASVLPRPMPGADWEDLAAKGIGDLLAHHVSLVRPKRLAVFGANILPLIGNDPPQGPADLRIFNHLCRSTPMLAARSLAALLEQPRWKARVWQAWLEWTG